MAGERQTEPHQAEERQVVLDVLAEEGVTFGSRLPIYRRQVEAFRLRVATAVVTALDAVDRAEVARLRAERDELLEASPDADVFYWKNRTLDHATALDAERVKLKAAEARVAELDERVASLLLEEPSKTQGLYAAIDELQARVAELEAERDRLKDESRVGWLERALAREQTLRAAAEDHIDRAVAERTAEMLMWLRREDPSALKGYWPALHALEAEFLAPARTREASDE